MKSKEWKCLKSNLCWCTYILTLLFHSEELWRLKLTCIKPTIKEFVLLPFIRAANETAREKEWVVIRSAAAFVSSLLQIYRACSIRGLAPQTTLWADTFHASAVNSSSGVYHKQLEDVCMANWGEGRPVCSVKALLFLPCVSSLFLPPPPSSHMVPPGAIIWQHSPPPHVTTSCHMTNMHIVITPQENAFASSGCTVHLIRGKH